MSAAKNRIFALFLPLVGGAVLYELLNVLSKVLPVPKSVFHSLLFFICFCLLSFLLLRLPAGRAGFRFSGTAVLETVVSGYERALVMSLWIFLFVSRGGWLPPSQPRPSYEL